MAATVGKKSNDIVRIKDFGTYDPDLPLVIEFSPPIQIVESYTGVDWSTYYGEDQNQDNIQICLGESEDYFYTAMNSF